MKRLTIDTAKELAKSYGKTVTLSFPSHGFTVEIGRLSALELIRIFEITKGAEATNADVNQLANVEVAALSIVEGEERIFDNVEGRDALSQLPGGILQRIASEAFILSGVDGRVEKKS